MERQIHRREFLKWSGLAAVCFVVGNLPSLEARSTPLETNPPNQNHHPEEETLIHAGGEGAGVGIFSSVADRFFNRLFGYSRFRSDRLAKDDPLLQFRIREDMKDILDASLFGPTREEFFFRFVPNFLISDKSRNSRWEMGIPTSILFAVAHNIERDEMNKLNFKPKFIPLGELIIGLFSWDKMRQKGYNHAVAFHSGNNICAYIPYFVTLSFYGLMRGMATLLGKDRTQIDEKLRMKFQW